MLAQTNVEDLSKCELLSDIRLFRPGTAGCDCFYFASSAEVSHDLSVFLVLKLKKEEHFQVLVSVAHMSDDS